MSDFEELAQLAREAGRRIFLAKDSIDLRATDGVNRVYVLELPGNRPGAAGGRIGGIGERRIEKLRCFQLENGNWRKICDIEDAEKLDRFELPYNATGLSVILPEGAEKVVTGVVDSDLVEQYNAIV